MPEEFLTPSENGQEGLAGMGHGAGEWRVAAPPAWIMAVCPWPPRAVMQHVGRSTVPDGGNRVFLNRGRASYAR